MELDRTDGGLRAVDERKKTVEIGTEGWVPSGAPSVNTALAASELGPASVETTVSGTVERLRLPSVHLVAQETATGETRDFGGFAGSERFGPGERLFRFAASVSVFLRTSGAVTVERTHDRYVLSFSEPTPVSLGFYSGTDRADVSVTVPATPGGVATALSLAAGTTTDTSPDRTWPTRREEPPSIRIGGERQVPDSLLQRRPDTGIELVVPPDLRYLFTAAPLTYYLGAEVCPVADATPRLVFDGEETPLGTLPAFQRRTASVLRRMFWLDCVARGAGPHGGDLAVADTFDTLGLDAARLYEASVAERLGTYLDVPFDDVSDRFPEWHLAVYVEPTYDHVETLPHLLSNLPHVFLPAAEPMDKPEFLQRTMADGFSEPGQTAVSDDTGTVGENTTTVSGQTATVSENTGTAGENTATVSGQTATVDDDTAAARGERQTTGGADTRNTTYRVRREVSSVDLVDPELGPARNHGWLADDVPIDVFKSFPEAYENRDRYVGEEDTPMSVVAVVVDRDTPMLAAPDGDDAAMRDEHDAAVAHYRERAPQLNAEVEIAENVTTAELARIFEAGHDLVHYIGHRDDDGLECADGALSTDSLAESNARTFFLNACGSYPEGEQLIRKGSVAGGVTFEKVGDEEAAQVGTAFARMMMHGFSMERAVKKARKQLTTPKDYAVVGDGTYVLTQTDTLVPPDVWVSQGQEDPLNVTTRHGSPAQTGGEVTSHFDRDCYRLWGSQREATIREPEMKEYTDIVSAPIVYDRKLWWPSELRNWLSE